MVRRADPSPRKYAKRCPWRFFGFRFHAYMHREWDDHRPARDVLTHQICTKSYTWMRDGIVIAESHANKDAMK